LKEQKGNIVDYFFKKKNRKQLHRDLFNELKNLEDKSKFASVFKGLNRYKSDQMNDDVMLKDFDLVLNKINKKRTISVKPLLKYVAVLVIGVFVTFVLMHDSAFLQKKTFTSYVTKKGESSEIILADGSRILLQENSELKIPSYYNKNLRNLRFNGKATFVIKHNPESPLEVRNAGLRLKVLGTVFNLETRKETKEIIAYLEKGAIELNFSRITKIANDIELLKPNEMIRFNRENYSRNISTIGKKTKIELESNIVSFNNERFENIVKILNSIYKTNIKILNSELQEIKFNAEFKDKSAIEILEMLKNITCFKITKYNNEIIITK
jgi:ferric-dicitrate binding protein FerR (iron transport regulator)